MIRILLADNQAIFRAGTTRVLEAQEDIRILGQTASPDQALELVAGTRGSVLLLAASVGADVDRILAGATASGSRVVLMTESNAEPAGPLLRRLDGLLTRHASAAELLACVRRVAGGERSMGDGAAPADTVGRRMLELLTPRELQIVGFIVQGWKNRQIADELHTKEQVVKNYLRSIYDKTGASDRLELALFTLHHRILAEAAAKAASAVQSTAAAPAS